MSIVVILIPLSLLLICLAVWAFIWAVDSGQFDDLETPGWEILIDTTAPDGTANKSATDTHSVTTIESH